MRRVIAAVATAVGACAALVGCSLQTTGAMKGDLHLHAVFDDVQQLAPGEAVDISDVQVGSVTSIKLQGRRALVAMSLKTGTKVPKGTVALLSQTSLLGEQDVSLELPARFDSVHGPWARSGDELPAQATQGLEAFARQAGQVLGALSARDLSATVQALSQGLGGRGPELNALVVELARVIHSVAEHQGDLAAVVDGLGQLGRGLADGSQQVGALIDNLASTTGVLARDREKLISTVGQLTRLAGDLNTEVLAPHLGQIETLIQQLDPILAAAAQGKSSLEGAITQLRHFVDILPRTVVNGQLLMFLWLAGFVQPGGATTPFPVGSSSLSSLLAPPK